MPVTLRDYDAARDSAAVRALFVQLQDEEHAEFPTAPPGEEIADEYLQWMHRRVAECDGRIWVAEDASRVVGFVTLLTCVARGGPDDGDAEHAEISELTLEPDYRGRGLGALLVAEAEGYARTRGAVSVRIAHHARNAGAHRFYRRGGYEPIMVLVEKRLR